jgi:DNA-binding LytR/AlgR family response regulator
MISAFIVEDEKPARERLQEFVDKHPDLNLAGFSENGKQAVLQIESLKPQLVFLDVNLPDISGIDVIKVIEHKPMIIFTTAYDEYALQAFEFNAIDFLLKPFSDQRFNQAVDKLKKRLMAPPPQIQDQIQQILSQWQVKNNYLIRIPSKIGDRIFILNAADIVYFASEQKLVFANQFAERFLINYTLEELQNRLDGDQFFRIHRSTIVNLNYVNTIEPLFGGTYIMKVKDKNRTKLNISRNAARQLRERLGW